MPNLGPGTEQHVNPRVTPTLVYTPTPGAPCTVQLYNEGNVTVWVGASGLDTSGGMPLPPGTRRIRLQNITSPLYAVSGVAIGTQIGTMGTTPGTAGTSAITLNGTVPTAFAPGTTIVVGNTAGTNWEAAVVATTLATTLVAFSVPLVCDHVAGSPVYSATPQIGQLRVTAGVV